MATREEEAQGLVLWHQLATTAVSFLTTQARQQLLDSELSEEELASHANLCTSLAGSLEFLLAPALSSLSDRMGRRPFMLAGPVCALPMRFLACLWPSPRGLLVERVISDFGRAFSGTTMCYAALADLHGSEKMKLLPAIASCNSMQGLGMVLSPLLASAIDRRKGPHAVFAAAAGLTALHLAFAGPTLKETAEERQPRGAGNPLGFLRLFTSGARVRALSFLLALQIAVDGKILQDQVSLVQMTQGWTLSQRSLWISAFGGAFMAGGQLTKPLLTAVGGMRAFTMLTHLASAAGFFLYLKGYFWLGLLPLAIGQQRRTATISWLLTEAEETLGAGRAQVLSMTANMRALVEALGAILYGMVLRAGTRQGRPQSVFLLPLVLTALSELAHAAAHRKTVSLPRGR